MDLALNNLQRLICIKPNQPTSLSGKGRSNLGQDDTKSYFPLFVDNNYLIFSMNLGTRLLRQEKIDSRKVHHSLLEKPLSILTGRKFPETFYES